MHVTLTRNGAAAKPSMAFAALRLAGERQGFPREPAACCIHAKHGHPARFRLARHGQRQGLPGRAAAAILAAVAFAAFGSRGNAKGSRASPRPSWPRCTLR